MMSKRQREEPIPDPTVLKLTRTDTIKIEDATWFVEVKVGVHILKFFKDYLECSVIYGERVKHIPYEDLVEAFVSDNMLIITYLFQDDEMPLIVKINNMRYVGMITTGTVINDISNEVQLLVACECIINSLSKMFVPNFSSFESMKYFVKNTTKINKRFVKKMFVKSTMEGIL